MMASPFVSKHLVSDGVRYYPLFSNFCEHFVSIIIGVRLLDRTSCGGHPTLIETRYGLENSFRLLRLFPSHIVFVEFLQDVGIVKPLL